MTTPEVRARLVDLEARLTRRTPPPLPGQHEIPIHDTTSAGTRRNLETAAAILLPHPGADTDPQRINSPTRIARWLRAQAAADEPNTIAVAIAHAINTRHDHVDISGAIVGAGCHTGSAG